MNNYSMNELKESFDKGFTDRVMKNISLDSYTYDRLFVKRIQRLCIGLAAACVLIVGGLTWHNTGSLDYKEMIGLSEYSDLEISEMEYFSNE